MNEILNPQTRNAEMPGIDGSTVETVESPVAVIPVSGILTEVDTFQATLDDVERLAIQERVQFYIDNTVFSWLNELQKLILLNAEIKSTMIHLIVEAILEEGQLSFEEGVFWDADDNQLSESDLRFSMELYLIRFSHYVADMAIRVQGTAKRLIV